MRTSLLALPIAAAVAAAAFAGVADAKKTRKAKSQSACDVDYLPIQEGNSWTYQPVDPALGGAPPANLQVTVTKIEREGPTTKIVFTETYRDMTFQIEALCENGGLTVPPSSFLFAAEPGGAILTDLENVKHKGSSYPSAKSLKSGTQWFEEFKADVIRKHAEGADAEHPTAQIEVERLATVRDTEKIETGIGTYRATKISFELRGRGRVGETSQEIPVGQEGALWLDDAIGVVRARDISGHEWELIDSSLIEK